MYYVRVRVRVRVRVIGVKSTVNLHVEMFAMGLEKL